MTSEPGLSTSRWPCPWPDLTGDPSPRRGRMGQALVWAEVSYFDHMELGQQVAVGQGQLVPIQELAPGPLVVIPVSVGVDLLWQGGVQVVVQFPQSLGQASLQGWQGTAREGSALPPDTAPVFRAK